SARTQAMGAARRRRRRGLRALRALDRSGREVGPRPPRSQPRRLRRTRTSPLQPSHGRPAPAAGPRADVKGVGSPRKAKPPRAVSSQLAAKPVGNQRPRVCRVPPSTRSAGADALALCELAGVTLDDWQAWLIEQALGEREDGSWACFEVGVCAPRQNGKSEL